MVNLKLSGDFLLTPHPSPLTPIDREKIFAGRYWTFRAVFRLWYVLCCKLGSARWERLDQNRPCCRDFRTTVKDNVVFNDRVVTWASMVHEVDWVAPSQGRWIQPIARQSRSPGH